MQPNRWRLGLRLRPRWGRLHIPLMKSMTHYSESLHQMLQFTSKMHQKRWRLGLRPRPRWGNLHAIDEIHMTHYSESLHQILPFMSKMHQNRWRLGLRPRPHCRELTALPRPLAVKGWDGDLVTTLVGVDFDMCPLACDRCPLAVLRLATGLSVGTTVLGDSCLLVQPY